MTAETSNARGEWVLVPREPTEAMIDAWRDAPNIWEDAYAAMLAAAPPPSVPVGWKLVPVETDARMLDAAFMAFPRFASDTEIDQLWAAMLAASPALAQQPAAVDDAMVFRLAVWMAKQDGHDDPHHLIWEGSPPEPWGEIWTRYEDDARAALTAAFATQPGGSENG